MSNEETGFPDTIQCCGLTLPLASRGDLTLPLASRGDYEYIRYYGCGAFHIQITRTAGGYYARATIGAEALVSTNHPRTIAEVMNFLERELLARLNTLAEALGRRVVFDGEKEQATFEANLEGRDSK